MLGPSSSRSNGSGSIETRGLTSRKIRGGRWHFAASGIKKEPRSYRKGNRHMKTDKCCQCRGWVEPPFESKLTWDAPATAEDVPGFMSGEECEVVRIERPLCRYCAYALSRGADGLTEEGKDALDLSDEA